MGTAGKRREPTPWREKSLCNKHLICYGESFRKRQLPTNREPA